MGRKIARTPALPFVKWAGGKRSALPRLLAHVPKKIRTYYEPFLGGGALFFALAAERNRRYERASISDSNLRLVSAYRGIQNDVMSVVENLIEHAEKHSKTHYYATRARDIDVLPYDATIAAWLIYLNRTCFNGLYRVNKSGRFNVPMGKYVNPRIVDEANLMRCAIALRQVDVVACGFHTVARAASEGDFFYFDPPYYPLTKTSMFASYTADKFNDGDHVLLRDTCVAIKARGGKVLVSNSDAPRVRELYAPELGFKIEEVKAARAINSKTAKRGKITELLIT